MHSESQGETTRSLYRALAKPPKRPTAPPRRWVPLTKCERSFLSSSLVEKRKQAIATSLHIFARTSIRLTINAVLARNRDSRESSLSRLHALSSEKKKRNRKGLIWRSDTRQAVNLANNDDDSTADRRNSRLEHVVGSRCIAILFLM